MLIIGNLKYGIRNLFKVIRLCSVNIVSKLIKMYISTMQKVLLFKLNFVVFFSHKHRSILTYAESKWRRNKEKELVTEGRRQTEKNNHYANAACAICCFWPKNKTNNKKGRIKINNKNATWLLTFMLKPVETLLLSTHDASKREKNTLHAEKWWFTTFFVLSLLECYAFASAGFWLFFYFPFSNVLLSSLLSSFLIYFVIKL